MKFIVDELPYYYDDCLFFNDCPDKDSDKCPRTWNKYKVSDDKENPKQCLFLKKKDN